MTLALRAGDAWPQGAGADADKVAHQTPRPEPRTNYLKTLVVEQNETSAEVNCIFCSVIVRGTVDGEANAVWGNVDVQGTVQGEVVAVGGSIRLRAGSHVTDEATAVGGSVVSEAGALLEGEATSVRYVFLPGQREFLTMGLPIFWAVHVGLIILLFATLRPRRVRVIALALPERPWLTILAGVLITSGAITALSALDLRGWLGDLVSIGLPLFLVAITIPGIAGISLQLGRKVRKGAGPVAAAILGASLLVILSAIPLVGFAVFAIASILAVGASVTSYFGFRSPPSLERGDASA